jgi:hypothetical protein
MNTQNSSHDLFKNIVNNINYFLDENFQEILSCSRENNPREYPTIANDIDDAIKMLGILGPKAESSVPLLTAILETNTYFPFTETVLNTLGKIGMAQN